MNDTPNRRTRRAAAATAPVAPAVAASAERAAIERDPTIDATAPAAVDGPIVPADAVADDAAVLPEPTLVARPDEPMPIVTASPILAVEPSAVDVVQADAKADRVAAGVEPAADPDGPHSAAAGQPTLTIEGDAKRANLSAETKSTLERVLGTERDILGNGDVYGLGRREVDGIIVITLDEMVHNLELLSRTDPIGMDIIRTRFFNEPTLADCEGDPSGYPYTSPIQSPPPTVTVIEVVGPPQGRRRAGRSFGAQAQRFLSSELDEAAIAMLRSDPLLAVGISEVEADAFGMPISAS